MNMEILTKPKGWWEILTDLAVGEYIRTQLSDAQGVRQAIHRMPDGYEFETETVEITFKAKKTRVETTMTCLQITRIA